MHIWLNMITNSLKVSKLHDLKNPKIVITIDENTIIYQDNCNGFKPEILKKILAQKQQGLGIKMSLKILEKSNWSMKIENYDNGAKFSLLKK